MLHKPVDHQRGFCDVPRNVKLKLSQLLLIVGTSTRKGGGVSNGSFEFRGAFAPCHLCVAMQKPRNLKTLFRLFFTCLCWQFMNKFVACEGGDMGWAITMMDKKSIFGIRVVCDFSIFCVVEGSALCESLYENVFSQKANFQGFKAIL